MPVPVNSLLRAVPQLRPVHLYRHVMLFKSFNAYGARACASRRWLSAAKHPAPRDVPSQQREQFELYLDTLFEWNERMNLIGKTTRSEAWERHIEDSLALLPVIQEHAPAPETSQLRLLDVGSGAGLPGLVLAIARPDWQITLLDSLAKRTRFLEAAVAGLGLDNVSVVCAKAEDAARQPQLRDSFHVVTARAVAETRILAELCLPFVRPGGLWVAPKGADPAAELEASASALQRLGGELVDVPRVDSVGPWGQRTAILVRKVQPTPEAYPRSAGRPNKRPL